MSAQQCLKNNNDGTAPGSSRQELAENYEDDDDKYKPLFHELVHEEAEAVERIKKLENKYPWIPPSNHYMRAYALERSQALERASG